MTKLIIGCSFIQLMPLEGPFKNFVKIGMGGCDNKTILNTLIECKKEYNPSYVFVSFTGLHRTSYSISFKLKKIFDYYDYLKQNSNELRIFSGGYYGKWTEKKEIKYMFKPTYLVDNFDHIKQNSLIDCMSAINFLKINNIKYNYSFAYDPLKPEDDASNIWGSMSDNLNCYWQLLDKSNYFDEMYLYNFAKNNDLLMEDTVHPKYEAYISWFESLKKLDEFNKSC